MACYAPLEAWRGLGGKIVFKRDDGITPLKLACGQCIGCRLERSRKWAIRCIHEASLHENNCFITLTYSEENLPHDMSLNKAHYQKFMKRLRKRYPRSKIKYFHCGEYGDKFKRPHYHACIFNFDFEDKILWKNTRGIPLYISKSLSELWPFGYATIGTVTFESAAYVARYVMKKITGKDADAHYQTTDQTTGEILTLNPEYTTMSNGIGKGWFEKYSGDVFPSDFITHKGKTFRPPEYYEKLYERDNPGKLEPIKEKRRQAMRKQSKELTPERLRVREQVKQLQLRKLKRELHS